MKAVLLHGYGGVEQLRYEDAPMPEPAPGEVLVRVLSTSVNPIDYKIRSGAFKNQMPLELPAVLGRDVAGEVTALGANVNTFQVGDLVMGLVNRSYAEYLVAPAGSLTRIPEGLAPWDAGVLPLVGLTGAQLIENGVRPRSGETILVTGALGGVGRTAVFVAQQHGATVIAGVRDSQKLDAASLGVESVVALDLSDEIQKLPELDAIADTVNGKTVAALIPKLKKTGRLGSVLGVPEAARDAGIDVREVWAQPDPDRLHRLAEELRDGKLRIPIAERMSLRDIAAAQTAAESGAPGKVALTP